MMQVPYRGPTNNPCLRKKFSRPGVPGFVNPWIKIIVTDTDDISI